MSSATRNTTTTPNPADSTDPPANQPPPPMENQQDNIAPAPGIDVPDEYPGYVAYVADNGEVDEDEDEHKMYIITQEDENNNQ